MHNELNSNSTRPEDPTTHHYDKSGAFIITDVLQYFQETIENPDNYSFRLHFTEAQDAAISIVYAHKPGALSAALTAEQSEALWSHVVESQHELESTYGASIELTLPPTYTRRSFVITRKSRRSAYGMIKQKSIQKEAYDFLEAAYSAGINIIIEGKTYSGRSLLLNTLMDSAKDYNRTILINSVPEMVFGSDHREITEIRGDDPSYLVAQVLRMSPYRVVMDDVFVDEEIMTRVVASAMTGTQFVATGYTSVSAADSSASETDELSSRYAEHPYELRVHVDISKNSDSAKLEFNVLSIKQIVHQKIKGYDITSNRLLFDHENKVAEPTRTLRRKMEAAKKIVKNNPPLGENPVSPLVSLTSEQRAELDEHREALREHFKTQNVLLRTSFREIDRILAKF